MFFLWHFKCIENWSSAVFVLRLKSISITKLEIFLNIKICRSEIENTTKHTLWNIHLVICIKIHKYTFSKNIVYATTISRKNYILMYIYGEMHIVKRECTNSKPTYFKFSIFRKDMWKCSKIGKSSSHELVCCCSHSWLYVLRHV